MTTIRLRRDTAANWTSNNPILAAGEPGVESDTTKIKYGDGTTHWNSLPYVQGDGTWASKTYVDTAVSNLVNSAPTTLDTLNELATALGDDPNFATTITTALGNKVNTSSLATVATSGSYNDLTNKPTIPSAGIASVYADTAPQLSANLDVNGKGLLNLTTLYSSGTNNSSSLQIASNGLLLTNSSDTQYQISLQGAGYVTGSGSDLKLQTAGGGSVKIGAAQLKFPNADGTSNQVLKTDGAGNLSWTTISVSTDWANPGSIGATTPASGKFTTLQATTGIDNTTIGATTAAAGTFSNLTVTGSVGGSGFGSYFSTYLTQPPGIGNVTPNSGAFTTLSASQTVTLSPASYNVAISPTGTGNVVISPATTGNINNMIIGATVKASGSFTSLSATGGVTFTPANAGVNMSPTGTGQVTINPGTTGNMDNMNIGATTAGTGKFTTLQATSGINSTSIGATTASTGKFTNLTWTGYTTETVYTSGSTTGTITPDCANGTTQKITLTGNITFNAFANPIAGQSMTLIITQSASGNNTLTSTMKFAGASKTLSTGANAIDIMTVFYDGSTYYASLAKGFA